MKKRLLAVAIIVTFLFGTLAYAQEYDAKIPTEEMQVIAAEDIGITPIHDIEEDEIEEDVLEEPEEDLEEPEEAEPEEVPEMSEPEEEEDYEEENEEVTESPAPPEGKVEGYIAGVYFDPNTVDCEICGGECYTCHDDHVYAHCVSMDERGYILEEWCTVCGHGTEKKITDEEFETLNVDCNVEF